VFSRSKKDLSPKPEDASPEEGDAGPEEGDASPEEGDADPEEGDASPEEGDAGPEEGDASPEEGDASPGQQPATGMEPTLDMGNAPLTSSPSSNHPNFLMNDGADKTLESKAGETATVVKNNNDAGKSDHDKQK